MYRKKQTDPTVYKYYYEDQTGEHCIEIHAGDNSGWSELTIVAMQEFDHRQELNDRYYKESKDALVELKKKRFQDSDDDSLSNPIDALSDERSEVEYQVFANETTSESDDQNGNLIKLRSLLETLTPDQKELYEEIYVYGKSNRQLAKEKNMAESTIRYRHNKLLKQLRKLFGI